MPHDAQGLADIVCWLVLSNGTYGLIQELVGCGRGCLGRAVDEGKWFGYLPTFQHSGYCQNCQTRLLEIPVGKAYGIIYEVDTADRSLLFPSIFAYTSQISEL